MWIVRLALRRPYTIAVMCLLIFIMGVLSMSRMAVDIFPAINIPVVAVVWSYNGLSAQEMERRVVLVSERCTPPRSTASSASKARASPASACSRCISSRTPTSARPSPR